MRQPRQPDRPNGGGGPVVAISATSRISLQDTDRLVAVSFFDRFLRLFRRTARPTRLDRAIESLSDGPDRLAALHNRARARFRTDWAGAIEDLDRVIAGCARPFAVAYFDRGACH